MFYNWNDWDCNDQADYICQMSCVMPTTTTAEPMTTTTTTEPMTTTTTTEPTTTQSLFTSDSN